MTSTHTTCAELSLESWLTRTYVGGMTEQRIALVTGANQGIGYALVEELANRMNPEDLVLLTGRNAERVAAAVDTLNRPAGAAGSKTSDASSSNQSARGGRARVEGRVLDVTDGEAVQRLAAEL